ncbi:acyltransferase [Legionella sp. PC997]|uniref:acyltransferase family protein n=1 Tax=Legionella sp. PC997 TaxID=2755562 RepID=UPI0015FBAB84|nr:acyltransferase [Legionella sp. PC997]QMT58824.1 acyltransferase [Legionella sp. PC997]
MKVLGQHRFFPGLNGLRAIAALCVFIQHTGVFLRLFGYQNADKYNHYFLSGHEAVLLFFVLSGFLITYRLLEEQNQTTKINLKKFYLGRILRIVPLQILIVSLSFLMFLGFYGLIPSYHEPIHPLSTFLLLLFIPNIAGLVDNVVNGASHIWSLGVENEFYLIWPLLLIRFKKSVLVMMVSFIIIKLVFELFILPAFISHIYSNHFTSLLAKFLLRLFPIENMAVGAFGAWLLFTQKTRILNIIFNPITQLLTYISIAWLISCNTHGISHYIEASLVPFIFLSLILNVSCNPRSFFKCENKVFNYLGTISYGIYMFHPIVVFLTIWFIRNYVPHDNALYVAFIYISCMGLTIGVAGLSFKYLEEPIMRLKRKKALAEEAVSVSFSASTS